jgi:hypothetical protein
MVDGPDHDEQPTPTAESECTQVGGASLPPRCEAAGIGGQARAAWL